MNDEVTVPLINTPNSLAPEPKSTEQVSVVESTVALTVREYVDRELKSLNKKVESVNNTMGVVIVVLAIGFITLLVAVTSLLVQVWGFNSNIQSDLIKSINNETEVVNNLTKELNVLKNLIKNNVSSPPAAN